MSTKEYYSSWYATHKQDIAARRKQKYDTDADVRQRAAERAARRRASLRKPRPVGYDIPFDKAAELTGITIWTLQGWRKKGYIPEPKSHGGRLWFTLAQIELLRQLKQFIDENGVRIGQSKRGKLEEVSNFIFANWQ